MALTLSTADSALKEFYLPAIREQLNQKVMMLQQIEKNTTDIEGRRAVLSLHLQRNSGVGARADGGTLPTAGNQGYGEERVPLRFNYGRIQLSGPTIRAMSSDKGSFTRAVQSETKGVTNDLRRDVNRQVFGTSDGVILKVTNAGPSTTVTFVAATTTVQMRQLEVGMLIDIGTASPFTSVTTANAIVSVNVSAKTMVLTSSVTTSNNDSVVRSGSGGSGAAQKEITGLQTIVLDTGALFNLNPATAGQASWSATNNNNSGVNRSVSENLFGQVMHAVQISSGLDANFIVSSDGVYRAFGNLLTALKRFQNTIDLSGGFKGLEVTAGGGTIPLIWDRDAPANTAFFLNTEHLSEFQMSDWEWMDQDGAVLSRVVGVDAYEAVLFKYHELATDQRNAHAILKDLTES